MDEMRLIRNKNDNYNYSLQESYFIKNTHTQNKRYKMLPYTTTGKPNDYVEDFNGVVGEFIRVVGDKELTEKFEFNKFNSNVRKLLQDSDGLEELLNLISKLFINNGKLTIFDLKSYNYIMSSGSEVKMAFFLYSMFIDEQEKDEFKKLLEQSESNVLYRLVYEALPNLKTKNYDKEYDDNKYECILPYVRNRFQEDFTYLMTKQDLVEKYLKRLLEYYYMFYVTQLAIKLNRFEKADFDKVESIYMTLSWEVTSQTRRSYEYGWQFVVEQLEKLFSHAITFEILAHNNKKERVYV